MRRYIPIIISILIVLVATVVVVDLKSNNFKVNNKEILNQPNIGEFKRIRTCAIQPLFLSKLKIPQPIAIDLSQQKYRGVAFLFGPKLMQSVHPKSWTRFDHFSSYILDPKGHMYLTPMPYITISSNTFKFQKNIYTLNSHSGKLSIWMSIDEVKAGANNPFGLIALDYDCEDNSLWVSAIDESSYSQSRGVIYHIDVESKKILQKVEGFDALSVKLLKSSRGKYLLLGSARDNGLYRYEIKDKQLSTTPAKLLELSDFNERIRKIDIIGDNSLRLETIPFAYTLVAETGEDSTIRENYHAIWSPTLSKWKIEKIK